MGLGRLPVPPEPGGAALAAGQDTGQTRPRGSSGRATVLSGTRGSGAAHGDLGRCHWVHGRPCRRQRSLPPRLPVTGGLLWDGACPCPSRTRPGCIGLLSTFSPRARGGSQARPRRTSEILGPEKLFLSSAFDELSGAM